MPALIRLFFLSALLTTSVVSNQSLATTAVEKTTSAKTSPMIEIRLSINNQVFTARLVDSPTTQALLKQLPLRMKMNDLLGNEKYFYLPQSLPVKPERPGKLRQGDLMLFGQNCFVLFYETFDSTYSYTRLGKIENTQELDKVLGSGAVTVEILKKISEPRIEGRFKHNQQKSQKLSSNIAAASGVRFFWFFASFEKN